MVGYEDQTSAVIKALKVLKAHLDKVQRTEQKDKAPKGVADAGAGVDLALFGVMHYHIEQVKPHQRER